MQGAYIGIIFPSGWGHIRPCPFRESPSYFRVGWLMVLNILLRYSVQVAIANATAQTALATPLRVGGQQHLQTQGSKDIQSGCGLTSLHPSLSELYT